MPQRDCWRLRILSLFTSASVVYSFGRIWERQMQGINTNQRIFLESFPTRQFGHGFFLAGGFPERLQGQAGGLQAEGWRWPRGVNFRSQLFLICGVDYHILP